jgi:hypothetical protein
LAHIDSAFRIETLSLSDDVLITQGTIDPSVTGYEAPEGSLFLRSFGTDSGLYLKTGQTNTDWVLLSTATASGILAGTYGTASSVGQFTVDQTGKLISAQNIEISLDAGTF